MHEVVVEQGDFMLCFGSNPNVVLWVGVSEAFVAGFQLALEKLELRRADPKMIACFSDDLGWPPFPTVSAADWRDKKFEYTEKRWLPVVLFRKAECPPTSTN